MRLATIPGGRSMRSRYPVHDARGNALVVTILIVLGLSGLVLGAIVATSTETDPASWPPIANV